MHQKLLENEKFRRKKSRFIDPFWSVKEAILVTASKVTDLEKQIDIQHNNCNLKCKYTEYQGMSFRMDLIKEIENDSLQYLHSSTILYRLYSNVKFI